MNDRGPYQLVSVFDEGAAVISQMQNLHYLRYDFCLDSHGSRQSISISTLTDFPLFATGQPRACVAVLNGADCNS